MTPSQCGRRRQWVRLIAEVVEVDPPRYAIGETMWVIAIFLDPIVTRKIMRRHPEIELRADAQPDGCPELE